MTPEQLERVRPRLARFAATMLGELNGYGQPAKGELYTRGLLTNGRRKSMQPMAERLGVDHQRLQRFITDSSWDYRPVRANLARWAIGAIDPDAYVIDDTGFPKDAGRLPVRGSSVLRHPGPTRELPDRRERSDGLRRCVVRGRLATVLPRVVG